MIHRLTTDIRDTLNIQVPIIDITAVINKLGGSFEYTPDTSYDCKIMRTNKAGCPNAFKIQIPNHIDNKRAKFKIAQMFGELFLHMQYITDNNHFNNMPYNVVNNPDINYGYINYFACAFLMPKDEYLEQIREHTNNTTVNTKAVAEYFNVDIHTASLYGSLLDVLQNF